MKIVSDNIKCEMANVVYNLSWNDYLQLINLSDLNFSRKLKILTKTNRNTPRILTAKKVPSSMNVYFILYL